MKKQYGINGYIWKLVSHVTADKWESHIWQRYGYDKYASSDVDYYIARCGRCRIYAVWDGEFISEIGVTDDDPWSTDRGVYRLSLWEQVALGVNTEDYSYTMRYGVESTREKVTEKLISLLKDFLVVSATETEIDIAYNFMDTIGELVEGSTTDEDFLNLIIERMQ